MRWSAFCRAGVTSRWRRLDVDATLVETHKRLALFCYKGFKAYQPLNVWWAEHGVVLHSEFRDGNVPAGFEKLRVFKEALAALPAGVERARLRTDTAGYQQDLLLYCGEGRDARFGVIEFAIGVDVTKAFRQAVRAVDEEAWKPLTRLLDGVPEDTGQAWAEVPFVPNWVGHSRNRADYRFLAIREPLDELDLGDAEQLPFPTELFGQGGRYKLFGLVTNRKAPGDEVIWWHRERCGKSEEVHAVMKGDPRSGSGAGSRRWHAALGAVRGQCGVVGDHGAGAQSEPGDEAAGARPRLGRQAHEGAALRADQPAGPRDPARPAPDIPAAGRTPGARAGA